MLSRIVQTNKRAASWVRRASFDCSFSFLNVMTTTKTTTATNTTFVFGHRFVHLSHAYSTKLTNKVNEAKKRTTPKQQQKRRIIIIIEFRSLPLTAKRNAHAILSPSVLLCFFIARWCSVDGVQVIDRCVSFATHAYSHFSSVFRFVLIFCYCYSGRVLLLCLVPSTDFVFGINSFSRRALFWSRTWRTRCVFDGRKKLLHKYREHTKLIIIWPNISKIP